MPSYSYVAINRAGKQVKDKMEASSAEAAKNSLRAIGYTILEIKELSVLNQDIDLPFLGNPTAKDMAIFCRQFQSILRAGVPVSTVLSMLGQQTENAKLATAIREMQASIEKGETLAGSMRKHPRIFSSMLVNMVAAGEESGNLEESFHQMEIYFDKAQRTKGAVVKAMIYPSILVIVMVVVLIVMATCVIIKGDLNGDGNISASDAREALRASAKLTNLLSPYFLAGDLNGDNTITAGEARKILRVSSKLDTF